MEDILIRPYEPRDRAAVREIAWQTAFMGKPGDAFITDRVLLEDLLTKYFTDYEPASCFVAESGGSVAGYLLGALDERMVGKTALKAFGLRFFARFFARDFFHPRNFLLLVRLIISFCRGEFRGEDFYREYPAVLHINLKGPFRGKGIGSRLIKAYLDLLREKKVAGVHLATMSPGGAVFFRKRGFSLLATHTRSYFRHITGKDVVVSILGKKVH